MGPDGMRADLLPLAQIRICVTDAAGWRRSAAPGSRLQEIVLTPLGMWVASPPMPLQCGQSAPNPGPGGAREDRRQSVRYIDNWWAS
jgi:hypothetical protein